MTDVIRVQKYNDDGTRTDRNPLTRTIIGVDSEGWNLPLSPDVHSANPHVEELVYNKDADKWEPRGWHSDVILIAADDKNRHKELIHDGSRREATETRARNYGLPTVNCLEFLLNLPADALVVGFVFSYDTTKILADLPLENMRELSNEDIIQTDEYNRRVRAIAQQYGLPLNYVHSAGLVSPASTVYEGYLIQYTPRKQLTITDLNAGRHWIKDKFRDNNGNWKLGKAKPEWKRHVIVWDVFTFFQKPFVGALEDYRCGQCAACVRARNKYRCDECGRCRADKTCIEIHCLKAPWKPEDLERITKMKLHRGAFDPSEQGAIVQYCIDECRYLAFLIRDLLIQIDGFDLELSRYDGSGAIASAWLKANKIKNYLPNRVPTGVVTDGIPEFTLSGLPEWIALCGYFGGRFEVSEIGYMGTLYGYDINSAYPAVTVTLPCLTHGRFERVTDYVPDRVGVYLAGSETTGTYAPFPFRTDDTINVPGMVKDAIYYCHGGKRWIWQDEIATARKHFGNDAIPIYDGWVWIPDGCACEPFASIPEMYKLRQQYVIDGNGIEKVIKLILNSLYGKTAQSIGWSINKTGEKKPPPFQCFIWAGLITSGCRAMILDSIMQPDADVVSIATDGILSRTLIPSVDAPKEKILGKWEATVNTDGYLFQSGVYTYQTEKNGKIKRKYATRGFSAREIPATELIAAYQNGEDIVNANPTESRFIPMKSATGTDSHPGRIDALEYIGQWIPSIHDVSFNHNRRLPVHRGITSLDDFGEFTRYSEPCIVPNERESAPYTPKQSWEDVMENKLINEPDYMEAESW